jgi:micrococcal nuclease
MKNRKEIQTLIILLIAASLSPACLASEAVIEVIQTAASTTTAEASRAPVTPTSLPTRTPFQAPSPTPSTAPFPTPSPSPTPALPGSPEAACVPWDTPRQTGLVTRIVDGDTIEVEIDGQRFPLRYIGIDTPELNVPGEPAGEQASLENEALVLGKTVLLVQDVSETDRFGRLLRYVFLGEEFVNYRLVRSGFAEAIRYRPDDACHQTFLEAQASAQAEGAGRWGLISPVAPPGDGACDPAYPDVCIPPPPPDLDCADIAHRRFRVLPPDPHNFDGDQNGFGCER